MVWNCYGLSRGINGGGHVKRLLTDGRLRPRVGVLTSLAISHRIMTWHSHLGPEMAFSYLSPNHLMSSLFDSTIGEHPILKIQHAMLKKVGLMMMIKMVLLSKIGWPSVGGVGGGAPVPTMQQAASRTHALTHARIAVTRSQSRCLHICWLSISSYTGSLTLKDSLFTY